MQVARDLAMRQGIIAVRRASKCCLQGSDRSLDLLQSAGGDVVMELTDRPFGQRFDNVALGLLYQTLELIVPLENVDRGNRIGS